MRRYNVLALSLAIVIAVTLISGVSSAQYWFQSGVRGSDSSGQNNGASVSIQTIYQNITHGSLGYWVGEDLSNGAFVQIGYEIVNSSGNYPQTCSQSGCGNYTQITQGIPTWFWEYFPAGYSGSNFYGGLGANGSAGQNGTFHTYSFSSSGNTWNFYFDGSLVGSVDLGTGTSGPNPPVAFAEQAATYSVTRMQHVGFKNLMYLSNGIFRLVPEGYSYVGYGKGSDSSISNPYGVQEVNNYVDNFVVGTGIPIPASMSILWSLGYTLTVSSQFGNISKVENYTAYSSAVLNAPAFINISGNERMKFEGWQGSGSGSYTGTSNYTTIAMDGNITEKAIWQTQYHLNLSSQYGDTYGSGWYDAGSTAHIYVAPGLVPVAAGERAVFSGWSGVGSSTNESVVMDGAKSISANWKIQYMVNATSMEGKTHGSGWYDANSTAEVGLNITAIPLGNGERLAFEKWSNGYNDSNVSIRVGSPVFMSAVFVPEYFIKFAPQDSYSNPINYSYISIDGLRITNGSYLNANETYRIGYVEYKNTQVLSNYLFTVQSSGTVAFKLPIYNVIYAAASVFGTPLNASASIEFKNGSSASFYLGGNGSTTLNDVPYGYSYGRLTYIGISQSVSTDNGSSVSIIMLTPSLIGVILFGVVAITVTAKLAAIKVAKRESSGSKGT